MDKDIELKLIINYEKLDEFCRINNLLVVSKEALEANGIFENLVYATENNFVGKSVYPEDMPLMMHETMWNKLIRINEVLRQSYPQH